MDENLNIVNKKNFDFKCPECNSNNIKLISLKNSFRPDNLTNNDILTSYEKNRLNSLPTEFDAILRTDKEDLLVCCKECDISSRIKDVLIRNDLRKWLKETIGSPSMVL
jgi:hypothetical protein